MPPQQTNTSAGDAARFGFDHIALAKDAMDAALAARPNAPMAPPGSALSQSDAAGPAAASSRSILSLLKQNLCAFQERRQRKNLLGRVLINGCQTNARSAPNSGAIADIVALRLWARRRHSPASLGCLRFVGSLIGLRKSYGCSAPTEAAFNSRQDRPLIHLIGANNLGRGLNHAAKVSVYVSRFDRHCQPFALSVCRCRICGPGH